MQYFPHLCTSLSEPYHISVFMVGSGGLALHIFPTVTYKPKWTSKCNMEQWDVCLRFSFIHYR